MEEDPLRYVFIIIIVAIEYKKRKLIYIDFAYTLSDYSS